MKKKIMWSIMIPFGGMLLGLIFIVGVIGGVASSSTPLEPPATEEQAYEYQYIGSELGVPWDIVLLCDAISAQQEGKSGIEEYNPLITSLQFCKLCENQYMYEPSVDADGLEVYKWVLKDTKYYTAADQILAYISKTRMDVQQTQVSSLINEINLFAQSKSVDMIMKYESTILTNTDYEAVLKQYIGLNSESVAFVMDLYESQYMMFLYGYEEGVSDANTTLPEVVVGNVTRDDLAKVAVSLMNHPYQMGSKYSKVGIPTCPLDCSGFVDWVYIQCFGRGVSAGGDLPDGVAMAGTALQYYACSSVGASDLKVGDLGFLSDPGALGAGNINHVGIYIGEIKGKDAFIHCAGRRFGYADRPRGRVGISISGQTNNINNVTGGTFSPAMNSCTFHYFRRPNFRFLDDSAEGEDE